MLLSYSLYILLHICFLYNFFTDEIYTNIH